MRGRADLALIAATAVAVAGPVAAFPEIERAVLAPGVTPVDVVVSDDDRLVGVIGDNSALAVLDTADVHAPALSIAACSGPVAVMFERLDGAPVFYVACSDGDVAAITLDDDSIPAVEVSTALYEVTTGTLTDAALSPADGRLFAFEEGESDDLIHVLDVDVGTVDGLDGFPMTSLFPASCMTVTPGGTYVVIGHEDGRITKLFNSGAGYAITTFDLLGLGTLSDVEAVDEGYAYLLENSGSVLQYWLTGDVNYMPMASGLATPRDLAIVEASEGTQFYIVDDAGLLSVVPFTGGEPVAEVALSASGGGGLAASSVDDGRVYVGAEEGALLVVGEAPWVEITAVDPVEVHEGDSVALTFTVDEDCSYDLYRGGDIDQSGTHLSAYDGTAAAGDTVQLELGSTDLAEGDNRLWIFATASGFSGRDSDTVALDTPPDTVAAFELGFGDGKLFVRWEASEEGDISHYWVYFADEYFDQLSGAPEFAVEGEGTVATSPAQAEHGEAGETLTYTLEGLTNGVEYCVAISGVDAGGQEGPWTTTLCDSPEQTTGAADDLGYCGACGTRAEGRVSVAAIAALTGGLALVRRRRGSR